MWYFNHGQNTTGQWVKHFSDIYSHCAPTCVVQSFYRFSIYKFSFSAEKIMIHLCM